jgi:hypothetical protein
MIDKEYEILITGEDHTNFILNSLCLFYPNKQITTLQEQDNLKLPQKDWIKRTLLDSNNVDLKTLLDQSISEKPDFIVVEDFKESYFTSKWYDINMLTINKTLLDSFINKAKNIEKPLVIIDLDRLKIGSKELIQFREIKELTSNKLYTILKLDENNNTFKFNLLSSEIDILEFRRKKEILNWILNSKIYDYEDFNNIVNDYYLDKDKLFDKLGIVEKEKNNKK